MKAFVVCLFVLLLSSLAFAEAPRVRFDAPQTVAARDVTTREFAFVHPDQRLIEATVSISVLLERGDAAAVREVVHRLESSTVAAQVVDFSPKTQLATTIVGTAAIERQSQHEAKLAASAGGGYRGLLSATTGGELKHQGREDVKFAELPALDLLNASGTLARGRGVYFKLKPSPRTTLEGAYDYVIILSVPRTWRAGFLYVTSQADAKEPAGAGRARFVVTLYQQGDAEAHRAAQRYAAAELDLRRAATEHAGEIERRMYPTFVHKLGITRDGALAKDWHELVLFRGGSDELLARLPADVRSAAKNLLAARQELSEFNTNPKR